MKEAPPLHQSAAFGKTKCFPGHWNLRVSRQSTGGKLVQFSFEDNLLFVKQECFPLAAGAIHLQTRDYSTVQRPERPSGIRGEFR